MDTRPGLRGKNLNAYALAGVRSDHESTELEEAREKLRLGMHLLVREGSTERNLEDIIALVTPQNSANCSFATDDKLPGDLVNEGHIDHSIRKAIAHRGRADHRDSDGNDQHGAALSIEKSWRDRAALLGGLRCGRRSEEIQSAAQLTRKGSSWPRTASISGRKWKQCRNRAAR